MVTKVLGKIFGTKHERDVKKLAPYVQIINSLESGMQKLTDDQLRAKTAEFKQRHENGESLDDLLPEAFAVCRESGKRVLNMRHFDVQLIGGVVLHKGQIAEMRTGEGKTLVATLPTYLNAIGGKGVHIVTVNDYLATRDAEWMGRIHRSLGLEVGTITHGLSDAERQASYNADVTYGTNNELGFDYLRDNMKFDSSEFVQREPNFAIVDECDSILIDEARTPLIISGPAEESTDKYYRVNRIIPYLKQGIHFEAEEKNRTVSLTEEGNGKVEELLKIDNVFDPKHLGLLHHVYQGLKAYHLYKLDIDYMLKGNEVVIVDEFTGRLMPGRRWSDGIHQAIEAKENVPVKSENQTLASITFQNYFRMYKTLSGMTGTADTEAVEFKKIYDLDVIVVPTNKPMIRLDNDDGVYKTEKAKFQAITKDVRARHEKGQPCLVGTISIEMSERLGDQLKRGGIRHNVLNAKHHEREAEIVSQAGRKGAVTIATNMAGRGTDIMLGGNPEALAKNISEDKESEEYKQAFKKFHAQTEAEKKEVIAAGGLCIVGTERHESRRIDNQLRGRSGRQGDPGESKFFLSLEDNLMRIFNGERIQRIMNTLRVPDDEPIVAPMVSRAIEGAQRKVEGHNFDIRKHLLDYDDVMNKQRESIYGLRRDVLRGEDLEGIVKDMLGEVTSELLDMYIPHGVKKADWDLDGLNTALKKQFAIDIRFEDEFDRGKISEDKIVELVKEGVGHVFNRQKESIGSIFDQIQRMILLQTIDARWKDHLARIDHIKEGINLYAYGQTDPLVAYKKEAFKAFAEMHYSIKTESLEKILKVQLSNQPTEDYEEELWDEFGSAGAPSGTAMHPDPNAAKENLPFANAQKQRPQQDLNYSGGEAAGGLMGAASRPPSGGKSETPLKRNQPKVGRNDPCPCGSGKKYKKCHGAH